MNTLIRPTPIIFGINPFVILNRVDLCFSYKNYRVDGFKPATSECNSIWRCSGWQHKGHRAGQGCWQAEIKRVHANFQCLKINKSLRTALLTNLFSSGTKRAQAAVFEVISVKSEAITEQRRQTAQSSQPFTSCERPVATNSENPESSEACAIAYPPP